MKQSRLLRLTLLVSALFTLGGVPLFGFPASQFGVMAGLPPDVPVTYRALAVIMMTLFAGAYLWLSLQEKLHEIPVAFGVIAKLVAFFSLLGLHLAAAGVPALTLLAVSGDFPLALLMYAGLVHSRRLQLAVGHMESQA